MRQCEQFDFYVSEDGTRAFVNVLAFRRVNESSINRLKKHLGNGFISISAYRTETREGKAVTDKTNFENTQKLIKLIRDADLGFIRLIGGWKDPNSEDESSYEQSFFIPYMADKYTEEEFEALAVKWADRFEQYSYLISLPSDEGKVRHMANPKCMKPYKKEDTFNATKLKSEDEYFSFLRKGRDRGIRKGKLQADKKWSLVSEGADSPTDIFVGYRIPTDSLNCMSLCRDAHEVFLWRREV